ncbi:ABC transporter ATP-binding protein [Dorea sp.]|uniref:ABC transporter ATP-binding protein n=1 Tax=Dorea sp. TaxID=2040332 RepID=UPI0035288A4B
MDREVIFSVEDLCKYYPSGRGQTMKAVDHVSFSIYKGETLGLVGESGCGKTTCGRTAIGLYEKTGGTIKYKGKDISTFSREENQQFRREVQMIFQDPYASLNPRKRVIDLVAEGIDIQHLATSPEERKNQVEELLEQVGLGRGCLNRSVKTFSGGQRQRIGIARALAMNPQFLVCDEPISALDVSVQAQIVNLLRRLQTERNLSCLFIAHDLAMVKYISDRVAVMYMGNIVELAPSEVLYESPKHPYTQGLLCAIPIADPNLEKNRERVRLCGEAGEGQSKGCKFAPRCPYATEQCFAECPQWKEVENGRFVACHQYQ